MFWGAVEGLFNTSSTKIDTTGWKEYTKGQNEAGERELRQTACSSRALMGHFLGASNRQACAEDSREAPCDMRIQESEWTNSGRRERFRLETGRKLLFFSIAKATDEEKWSKYLNFKNNIYIHMQSTIYVANFHTKSIHKVIDHSGVWSGFEKS